MDNHHKYLFATSHFSLLFAIYAYNKHNHLWIVPAGVYVNSINYWRNPTTQYRYWVCFMWTCVSITSCI